MKSLSKKEDLQLQKQNPKKNNPPPQETQNRPQKKPKTKLLKKTQKIPKQLYLILRAIKNLRVVAIDFDLFRVQCYNMTCTCKYSFP